MEARDKTRARGKVRFDGCPRIVLEIVERGRERVKNDEHDLSVSRRSRELDTALGERRDRSGVVRRREADRPEKIHGVPL